MTPIHSPHPPLCEDRAEAQATERATGYSHRDGYPALPWTVEDLPGTQWVNIHTCEIETVEAVDNPKIYEGYKRIGLMYPGRLVVEHWVRWDVLPPHAQYRWLLARLIRLQSDIAYEQKMLTKKDMDGSERNYRKESLKRMEARLATQTEETSTFADLHGFVFDAATITNTVAVQRTEPAQLALFAL